MNTVQSLSLFLLFCTLPLFAWSQNKRTQGKSGKAAQAQTQKIKPSDYTGNPAGYIALYADETYELVDGETPRKIATGQSALRPLALIPIAKKTSKATSTRKANPVKLGIKHEMTNQPLLTAGSHAQAQTKSSNTSFAVLLSGTSAKRADGDKDKDKADVEIGDVPVLCRCPDGRYVSGFSQKCRAACGLEGMGVPTATWNDFVAALERDGITLKK